MQFKDFTATEFNKIFSGCGKNRDGPRNAGVLAIQLLDATAGLRKCFWIRKESFVE